MALAGWPKGCGLVQDPIRPKLAAIADFFTTAMPLGG
jgi:hypothetical protein